MKRAVGRAVSRAMQRRTAPVGRHALVEALDLVARVERASRLLREGASPPRHFHMHDRFGVAEGVVTPPDLPFTIPTELTTRRDDLPRAGADVVRVGKGEDIIRVRAFYLDPGLTVVIHGRLLVPWPRPAALHRGAEVVERVYGLSDLVVPRPLERGRSLRRAWLVEEIIDGQAISPDEWPALVPRVLEGLVQMWIGAGVETTIAERVLSARRVRSALKVLDSMVDLDVDHRAVARGVRRIAGTRGSLLVGWCHGDPMRTNVLRMPDDRLALVDWEAAGRRPLGWDGSKAVMSLIDPLPAVEAIAPTMERLGGSDVLSWRDQLAVGCLVRLARSSTRLVRAELSGNNEFRAHVVESRRRNLTLLARLLAGQ